jgi:putative ABC transport system permease protein
VLHDLLYRLKALIQRQRLESELDEELRFHLACQADKNKRTGMSLDEALLHAKSALGGTEQTREACRDARGTRLAEDLLQDCRYAFRGIWRSRAYSALILFVLALAIGVNTAVFSVVNDEIIKPLPFRDSSRLLVVWDTYLPQFAKVGVSPAELQSWQTQKDLFQGSAWYRYVPQDGNLSVPGSEPVAVHADFVSSNLFPMLGVSPLLGRGFKDAEDPWSALISERLWRSRFAADPDVAGKTIGFNDRLVTIVGVIPSTGQFPDWADLWLPKGPLLGDELTNPVRHALGFIARLRPGIEERQADARLVALSRQLAREHPKTSTGWGIRVSGLQDDLIENVRPALLLLFCAASFLLLIGSANIASLLLSRASARTKEIAIRAAVGAGALRILRQLMTESLVLAVLGGAGGLVVAKCSLALALPARSHLEPTVLLFLLTISLATGVLFGLAPAIQLLRADTQSVMKSGAMTNSGMTTRAALVVLEIALTMMLVIGAGILTKSFLRLMKTNPGFNSKGVLTMRVLALPSRKPELLFRLIRERLLSVPGIKGVAVTNALPLIADRANTSRFNVPGSPLINLDALPGAQIRTASAGYFKAMQIALKAGRRFTERDLNQPVVIINETMAKRFWPRRDPVGLKFINGPWGPHPTWATIVGVVADVKQFGLDSEPSFDLYYPSLAGQYLIVKTSGDPLALKSIAQRTIHSVDPEVAVSDIRSMDEIAAESALRRRWTMGLLVAFASVALALALVGIFGVMSWSVAQRTREIGIRMALGAQRQQMLSLFVRYGLKLALSGLGCGMLASFALRRALAKLVYGVSTGDPAIYVLVSVLMLASALVACYIPARRAVKVDPLVSLRYE